jgi:hypothetical protein
MAGGRLTRFGGGQTPGVSLALALTVFIIFAVGLIACLAYVMSRPKDLRPHRPNPRRIAFWRRAREGRLRGGGTL